jgi:branched-chain amino acid transport system ATP-binding protein
VAAGLPAGEPASGETLLSVRDVSLRFGGVAALDGVSFDIGVGQIVGLIGPNGAGKTSLFNCISRLYQPTSGSIRLDDRELLRLRAHEVIRRGIARTFQNVALFARMSVLDNVLVGDHYRIGSGALASALQLPAGRRAERQAVDRAVAALDIVEMRPFAETLAASLPFAMQKRVELARALVSEPRLLLLDEPAGGLNHTEVHELGQLIKRVQGHYRITVLLVEHHMNLVMTISDHVVVLSFGRKIAEGKPDVVRNNPAVIEAYLGTAGAAA